MACTTVRMPDGGQAFICQRGRRGARCGVPGCGAACVALCDFPTPRRGKPSATCDFKLCESHRHPVPGQPDTDHCPAHRQPADPRPADPPAPRPQESPMQFVPCENTGFHLRLALLGPSGSGKTYTALRIATELGYDKVAIIDTENRSARRYARTFRPYSTLELNHFSPAAYIASIRTAEAAGFEVLIIDSLSHAWMGRGGVLELVDQSARRQARGGPPSSFNGWREVTPEHNRLVEALIHAELHIIVTMRVKTEYVVEKDAHGKSVPRKVGLAPVQRDGLEYEFDVVGELTMPEHDLIITKSRLPKIADLVVSRPGAELAQDLRAWLDGAEGPPPARPPMNTEAPAVNSETPAVNSEAPPMNSETPAVNSGPLRVNTEAPALNWTGARCEACQTPILWVKTRLGEQMPVLPLRQDGTAVQASDLFDARTHHSHFIDCPDAERFRRKSGKKSEPAAPVEALPDRLQRIELQAWFKRIEEVGTSGDLAQLQALRAELNGVRRTKEQGEELRRALARASSALQVREAEQAQAEGRPLPPELRELTIERDAEGMGALQGDS